MGDGQRGVWDVSCMYSTFVHGGSRCGDNASCRRFPVAHLLSPVCLFFPQWFMQIVVQGSRAWIAEVAVCDKLYTNSILE